MAWAVAAVLGLAPPGFGQTSGTWIGTAATGNWSTSANWSLTGADPFPNNGGVASFGGGTFAAGYIGANVTVTQDVAGLTLGGMNFNNFSNPFAYTIGGTNAITFVDGGSGFATVANAGAGTTANTNTISAPVVLNTNLRFTSVPGSIANLSVSGVISGTGGVTVATSTAHDEVGLITLTAANTFSGGVTLTSGVLRIGNNASLGTGTLTVNGGALNASAALSGVANAATLNSTLTFVGANAMTLSGVLSGAGGITNQSRAAALTLSGTNAYTGATVVTNEPVELVNTLANAGSIVLSGANGSALGSSSFLAQAGGTITLDNSGVANAIARIGTTAPVTVNNGTFRVNGGTATTGSFTQQAGTLTAGGFGTVIVNPGSATTEGIGLNFSTLSRGAGNQRGTFLFNGGNAGFGTAAAGVGVPRLTFGTAPITASGIGTPGVSIIPYAIGSATPTGTGTDLVTYDTNGVRLLTAAEYAATMTAGTNVKLTTTGTVTTNTDVAVQSLVLSPATAVTLAGTGTLSVTSGTVVSTLAGTNTIAQNLNFGSAEGVVFVTSSASNNLAITGTVTGSNGLTKSGPGVLILTPTPATGNTYTGPTTVAGGLVLLSDARAFGADTSPIQFWAGTLGNNAGLQNTTAGLALVLPRDAVVNDGFTAFDANSAGTRGVLALSGTISGAGGVYIANSNFGTTFLSGTNTYTGQTRIFSGNLAIASEANLGAGTALDLGTTVGAANPPLGIHLYGNWTTSRVINLSSSGSLDTGAFTATLNGPMTALGLTTFITKFGSGTLNFTHNQNAMSGLIVNDGTVLDSGSAQLLNVVGGLSINSGRLQLDYSSSTLPKLSSAQNVQFGGTPTGIANGGGGTLELDAGTNAVTQAVGIVTLPLQTSATAAATAGRIRMSAGAGGSVVLRAGTLAISSTTTGVATANTSLFVAGDGLGSTTKLLFNAFTVNGTTVTNPLVGGAYGTAAGTPTLGILPGGYGDTTAAGNGSGLITYDSTPSTGVGVRLLAPAEYVTNSTGTAATNVLVTAATTAGAADAINALVVRNGNTLTVPSGGTLTINSGTVLSTGTGPNVIQGSGTGGGGATLAGTTGTGASGFIFATPTDLTVRAVLTGATGALIKTGPGTLTFDPLDAGGTSSAASTLAGVDVYEGTLQITNPTTTFGVLGAGNLFFANNARLRFNGIGATTSQILTLYGSGGTLDLTGTFLQLNSTSAQVTGSGALTLEGGTLVLGAGGTTNAQTNTNQSGTNLTGGVLVLNATGNPLGLGTLNLRGGQLGVRGASRSVAVDAAVFANTTFVNNLSIGGTVDTTNSGLTFTLPTRLEASVTLTNGMTGNGTVTFAGSVYDNPFVAPSALTLAGTAGAGPIVLGFSNAYRGGTTVASGTVQVNNPFGSGTGSGPVAVNGGTLQGTGFVFPSAGNGVTVAAGGTLQPGSTTAAGTLTVGTPAVPSSVTLNGTFAWNVQSAGTTSGTAGGSGGTVGKLVVNGNLTFSPATFSVNSVNAGATGFNNAQPFSWAVASATGTATVGSTPTFLYSADMIPASGASYTLSSAGGTVYLTYSPVPEPATVFGLAAVGVCLSGMYRRFRRNPARAVCLFDHTLNT